MIINRDTHPFLFVHVPKTGGTSINVALKDHGEVNPEWAGQGMGSHSRVIHLKGLISSQEWRKLFKFSFVRNPWALRVSMWMHVQIHQKIRDVFEQDFPTFDYWIKWIADHRDFGKARCRYVEFAPGHFHVLHRPQSWFICDPDNNVLVDRLGRFEDYLNELRSICRQIGIHSEIPWKRKSKYPKGMEDYRAWYTPQTAEIIENVYRKDVELFHYSFE